MSFRPIGRNPGDQSVGASVRAELEAVSQTVSAPGHATSSGCGSFTAPAVRDRVVAVRAAEQQAGGTTVLLTSGASRVAGGLSAGDQKDSAADAASGDETSSKSGHRTIGAGVIRVSAVGAVTLSQKKNPARPGSFMPIASLAFVDVPAAAPSLGDGAAFGTAKEVTAIEALTAAAAEAAGKAEAKFEAEVEEVAGMVAAATGLQGGGDVKEHAQTNVNVQLVDRSKYFASAKDPDKGKGKLLGADLDQAEQASKVSPVSKDSRATNQDPGNNLEKKSSSEMSIPRTKTADDIKTDVLTALNRDSVGSASSSRHSNTIEILALASAETFAAAQGLAGGGGDGDGGGLTWSQAKRQVKGSAGSKEDEVQTSVPALESAAAPPVTIEPPKSPRDTGEDGAAVTGTSSLTSANLLKVPPGPYKGTAGGDDRADDEPSNFGLSEGAETARSDLEDTPRAGGGRGGRAGGGAPATQTKSSGDASGPGTRVADSAPVISSDTPSPDVSPSNSPRSPRTPRPDATPRGFSLSPSGEKGVRGAGPGAGLLGGEGTGTSRDSGNGVGFCCIPLTPRQKQRREERARKKAMAKAARKANTDAMAGQVGGP